MQSTQILHKCRIFVNTDSINKMSFPVQSVRDLLFLPFCLPFKEWFGDCEGVGYPLHTSPPSLYECASVTYVMHTSLFYYVQILFLAHILANICSNLIFELPSLPCISHILGLLDLKYVLHITEDEFRIALPHRQM